MVSKRRLKPVAYELEIRNHWDIVQIVFMYGPKKMWAIRRNIGSESLCKVPINGFYFFTCTASPSNRDESFYDKFRFATAEEAADFWYEHRDKIVLTQDDVVNMRKVVNGKKVLETE